MALFPALSPARRFLHFWRPLPGVAPARFLHGKKAEEDRLQLGSLCYDHVFSRVLGKEGESEPLLEDLLSAWYDAHTNETNGAPKKKKKKTSEASAADSLSLSSSPSPSPSTLPPPKVTILPRTVRKSILSHGKGSLEVDVRFEHRDAKYIVEIQHRPEPLFPHRAVQYVGADIAEQEWNPATGIRPVHLLAFCDYDFQTDRIGVAAAAWRAKRKRVDRGGVGSLHVPALDRLLHFYSLHHDADLMHKYNQRANPRLSATMRRRMSFTFAILPNAPPLPDLSTSTPPLVRWASLVAHLTTKTIADVPPEVRALPAVNRLVQLLAMEREMIAEEEEKARMEALRAPHMEEWLPYFREGREAGTLATLHDLGILSVEDYIRLRGSPPPPDIEALLKAGKKNGTG